jgi:hypothetical protein
MVEQRCLFCGGDRSEPNHQARCDGQQGGRDEGPPPFPPLLISGVVDATWDTSEAAAVSVIDLKDTQRAAVYETIVAAKCEGCTDQDIQDQLGIDGNSERPRRWELWKLGWIRVREDANGQAVRRRTRTRRLAVVWVAADSRP